MSADSSPFIQELNRLFSGLDTLSYYDFLGLTRATDYVGVREAFYARAQRFHPDRYVAVEDDYLKKSAYAVFKRMTEAYNVLSDPELRRRYDDCLEQGESRLAVQNRSRRLSAQERQLNNAFARIYYRAAQAKLEKGNLPGAKLDVELGLSLEDGKPLQSLLDEINRRSQAPTH